MINELLTRLNDGGHYGETMSAVAAVGGFCFGLGCGMGRVKALLARKDLEYKSALDRNSASIELLKKNLGDTRKQRQIALENLATTESILRALRRKLVPFQRARGPRGRFVPKGVQGSPEERVY